jgi:UDP-GlcNAc:undecaprenyl-phosphate GlcNAc-1-phosphate transferase
LELNGSDFFLLFFVSFALTSVLTPFMRLVALRFGVLDAPTQEHKTHFRPIPYLGGVAIVISTVSVSYGASLVSNFSRHTFQLASTIILPAILMAIVGLIDDIKNLQPWPRFIAQNLIALVSAFILVSTQTLGSPTGIVALDLAITVFWLVGITNAINFFDNVDGGASGSVAISSLALALLAINNNQFLIAGMSIVLAGSTLGFLIWNKPPARIYMGDAGALFLGLLLASLAVRLDTSANPT